MSIDWDSIETFIGFGRADAPVVFLGMEEGLRRDSDLLEDLRARSRYTKYMDLREAQEQLDGPGSYFGAAPIIQKTWRPMCDLMLRRSGILQPSLDQRRRYQADLLGRRDGQTLLTELLPYPHSDNGQWLYAEFHRYPTRSEFERIMLPKRRAMFQAMFEKNRPELIVAYGKANWPAYKAIFGKLNWREEEAFEIAEWGQTRIVLAHQFAGREFNTDDQLERFAGIALRGNAATPNAAAETLLPAPSTAKVEAVNDDHGRQNANRNVRTVFGALVRDYRAKSGLSAEQVSAKAKDFAGQGNPGGVRNLEAAVGWVHPGFAEGVFRAIEVPDAAKHGRAYRELKNFFGGVTRKTN